MLRLIYHRFIVVFLASFCFFIFSSQSVEAQSSVTVNDLDNAGISNALILGDASPVDVAISIINWSLGLLALIAVIVILIGGFTWLLSGGDEEKINKAKSILRNAFVGLLIILSAWGITVYLINLLLGATDANDTGNYTEPNTNPNYGSDSPFYIDHTNPQDTDDDVSLCHLVSATFSLPLQTSSVDADSFKVTIPQHETTNPNGGRSAGQSCTDGKQCLSGVCNTTCVGNQLTGTFGFSESKYSAAFYPAADFYPNTLYEVEFASTIKGVDPESGAVYSLSSGDPQRVISFSTGEETDITPPKVNVSTITPYPADGATEICLNSTLQVSFSESLDPTSPNDQNVWLYQADANGDGISDEPSDALDVGIIFSRSIGGEPDDTIVTEPQDQLKAFTEYGMSLYSGDAATTNFAGAIYDTCGNPLSGDFDDDMEGNPTDDFIDPASSGASQAFCTCTKGVESCKVTGGNSNCSLPSGEECSIEATCDGDYENFTAYIYPWTWTTGNKPYCQPEIDSISQEDNYYSEDQAPLDETGQEDTGKVLITGNYLYPFYDVGFYNGVSAAGLNCFDEAHNPSMSCFITNNGSTSILLRTPVASRTGKVSVTNSDGSDYSNEQANILSPYIRTTSPEAGPIGQYITIKGQNFGDYDPAKEGSEMGKVFFNDIEAQVVCSDGWNDDQIIVRVPEGFNPTDTPKIQVLTAEERNSNRRIFTMKDGEPGPGLCLLEPSCSDTGQEDVIALGENFGDEGTVYFQSSDGSYQTAGIKNWNVYSDEYESQSVLTNSTPVRNVDTYDFTAANSLGISNGLDYEITCSIPPKVFEYYQCQQDADTVYLPNPTGSETNACTNSVVMFAFTNDMNDQSVNDNVKVQRCNYGYDGENRLPYDSAACDIEVPGTFIPEYLNDAYLGGKGTQLLNGTKDVDGDGNKDAYRGYVFDPTSDLEAGYYYRTTISDSVVNKNNVHILSSYTWSFQVRNNSEHCVADYLGVSPSSQTISQYNSTNLCPDNYTVNTENYSLRARQYTENCLVLEDVGTYDWAITNPETKNVIQFGDDNDPDKDGLTDTTTSGYNNVCVQGQQQENLGTANVNVGLEDPADGSVAASDDALVTVDYGYCLSDADCYTNKCRDTYCDLTTNHCAPDITGFTPNTATDDNPGNDADADVGPAGCVTLNGCYFGTDRVAAANCTCTSLKKPGFTCSVSQGDQTCLLADRSTVCSLGEETCTLSSACTAESDTAFFYDSGGLRGCTCEAAVNDTTCTIAPGGTTCVAPGTTACTSDNPTYNEPRAGSVQFNTTESDYITVEYCGDVWNNDQVIVQVPDDLPANDYGLTLQSYYYSPTTESYLQDTYSSADGGQDCTVGTEQTPCLCKIDPSKALEGKSTDLYGEAFDLLVNGKEAVSFKGSLDRKQTDGSETWVDSTKITGAKVPDGAISSNDAGVQVENNTLASNALGFTVSCNANLDCGTGCCLEGQCADAAACNTCETDTDCQFGSCRSTCESGICTPYITALSPSKGAVGQPVTVQGCHFGTYYDPADFTEPYSKVVVDSIEAPLACTIDESWNNNQIIINIPDGIFGEDDTSGAVQVTQVSNPSGGARIAQVSNKIEFKQDNSCSEVDVPVLCSANPPYSTYTQQADTKLSGEYFSGEKDGYCTCRTESFGDCKVAVDGTTCAIDRTTTYYVNPEDTEETCQPGLSNKYVFYNDKIGKCESSTGDMPCTIAQDASSCSDTQTQSCALTEDYTGDGIADTCSEQSNSYVTQSGTVDYYKSVQADINYDQLVNDNGDDPDLYYTNVPNGAETGDVTAISTTSKGSSCVSNGLEYPITCTQCGDCTKTNDGSTALNCNFAYEGFPDGVGVCTANPTGYCRTEPQSCCGATSCVYDSTTTAGTDEYDPGTCAPQPLVVLDDTSVDPIATSGTNPQPGENDICPNGEFSIEFDLPVTTSDVFETLYDPEGNLISTSAGEFEDFKPYIKLYRLNDGGTIQSEVIVDDIAISSDFKTLTLHQSVLLDFNAKYALAILVDDAVEAGTNHQQGIVSFANGVAAGCSDTQAALGMCDNDAMVMIPFTTVNEANFAKKCGPGKVDLEADNVDFIEDNYTYTKSGKKEKFAATVYAAGSDELIGSADDQPITRIKNAFYWEYDWGENGQQLFDSLQNLETDDCPIAGIITQGSEGSCSCTLDETCTIKEDDTSCQLGSGLQCATDSPNGKCDTLDSNYDEAKQECTCSSQNSCTLERDETTCTVTSQNDTASCTLSAACNEDTETWKAGNFIEDKSKQSVTADGKEGSTAVEVSIIGDGSVEDGWSGSYIDQQTVTVFFCADVDNLASYSNSAYNLYWAYCRGSDPQSSSFLPEFKVAFERDAAQISAAYGSQQDFIYEVAFKDARALTNDPDANNNTIAIRVYENDLDNNPTTFKDSVNPALWFLLRSANQDEGYDQSTVDDYQSVTIGNTTYIAATNLSDTSLTPYIFVIAYSKDAEPVTGKVVQQLIEHIDFNHNASLAADCQLEKSKIVRDTKRLTDLGTISYLLSSYYYNDSDSNDENDFPDLTAGSYITNMTSSKWPSWSSALSNALGQDLPTDPVNKYDNAAVNCPYNAPDLSAGDNPASDTWTYYDKSGTCWDPILKDYYGPPDSYVYQYQYSPDTKDFNLYSNMEYTGSHSWKETIYNPCSTDSAKLYSDRGCATFNYSVDTATTTLNSAYADNFK